MVLQTPWPDEGYADDGASPGSGRRIAMGRVGWMKGGPPPTRSPRASIVRQVSRRNEKNTWSEPPAGGVPMRSSVAIATLRSRSPTRNPIVTSPLPANVAEPLQVNYQEFQAGDGASPFTSSDCGTIAVQGSSVGVEIPGNGGNFATLVSDMDKLGFVVSATDATTQTITGLIPIDDLANAAEDSLTLSITPEFLAQSSGLWSSPRSPLGDDPASAGSARGSVRNGPGMNC